MLKILLKEPVTSGKMPDGNYVNRIGNYMLARGEVAYLHLEGVGGEAAWLSFITPAGKPFVVSKSNIAYIEEVPEDYKG